ncbi:hypothetical protein B296_00047980 [Ensete ventricosum]|uniref:Uncharacterized protein n=1 Tax=Ensete ventricosum TaxID=4639 RepID=A0A426XG04_ENSVE|nr:hypothetical protein B296_00047980 [Ensete ventricosum]
MRKSRHLIALDGDEATSYQKRVARDRDCRGRAASNLQVLPLLPLLPWLIPPGYRRRRLKSIVIDRFRVVTGRKQPQSTVLPGSGQSVHQSVSGLVQTARTGWYRSKRQTLVAVCRYVLSMASDHEFSVAPCITRYRRYVPGRWFTGTRSPCTGRYELQIL